MKAGESQDSTLFFLKKDSPCRLWQTPTLQSEGRGMLHLRRSTFCPSFAERLEWSIETAFNPKLGHRPMVQTNVWRWTRSVGRSQIHQKSFYRFQDCREIKAHLMAVSHETFRHGRNALVLFHVFCHKSEDKLHSNLSKDWMQMDKVSLT